MPAEPKEPFDMALVERYRMRPDWKRYASLVHHAADAGNDWARYIRARWLLTGSRTPAIRRDVPAGIRELRRASRSCPHAMVELARCYEDGTGVAPNRATARRLLAKATRYGSVFALVHLAWIHGEGIGVRASPRRARQLMQRAAGLGLMIDDRGEVIATNRRS